ncbi:MAG: SWIM zinc finger family protein [Bacteroidota bacterium]
MRPLPFREPLLRANATENVFDRAVNYVETGAVRWLVRRGEALAAEVRGSEWKPYQVRVTLDGEGVREVRCSCPYDWGGWCKHAVAALLVALDDPPSIEERPPLGETLAALEQEKLADLLSALADEHPELLAEIEGRINPAWVRPAQPEDEWGPEGW